MCTLSCSVRTYYTHMSMQLLYIVFIHSQEYIGMYVLATYIHYDYLFTLIIDVYIFVQYVYTLHTHCLHANLLCSCGCIHIASNMYSHCIHIACNMYSHCIHIACTLYTHCKQHVYTLSTHESVFLQCVYQLQIRCIYSVYTITGAYVHTHMQSE